MNEIRKIVREVLLESDFDCKSKLDSFTSGEPTYDFYYYDEFHSPQKIDGAIIYIRFGEPKRDESGEFEASYKYIGGKEQAYQEDGVSVFEAGYDGEKIAVNCKNHVLSTSYDMLFDSERDVYVLDGETVDSEGSDMEILLDPSTVKIICKVPKEILVKTY